MNKENKHPSPAEKELTLKEFFTLTNEEAEQVAKIEGWEYSNTNENAYFDLAGLVDYIQEIGINKLKPETARYLKNRY